jgi:hypothetical protein
LKTSIQMLLYQETISQDMNVSSQVMGKLELWVAKHSAPDKPLLVIGRNLYSPNQVLEEIKKKLLWVRIFIN